MGYLFSYCLGKCPFVYLFKGLVILFFLFYWWKFLGDLIMEYLILICLTLFCWKVQLFSETREIWISCVLGFRINF